MKLISYRAVDNALQFGIHAGILQADGQSILPLAPFGFADARAFIAASQAAFTALNAPEKPQSLIPVAQVQILAPILNPPRVFAIGLNYQEHAAESKMKVQVVPTVFFKLTASIVGDGAEIVLPTISTDMANVSLAVPTIHPLIGIETHGAVNHQREFAAACITPSADDAVRDGAIALAWTAIDAATEPELRARLLGA